MTIASSKNKNWVSYTDEKGILWLSLDQQGNSANSLSADVLNQLDDQLERIRTELPTAVVFKSAKKSGFIAGADIREFLKVKNVPDALALIKRAQNVFNKIESLPCPTIAMIEGFCMGGGTELALACDYRIALDSKSTIFALPEVKLGIHPAFGGLVRMTKIINPLKSLEFMLTGRSISAKHAKAIGLVDSLQPRRQILKTVSHFALSTPEKQKMDMPGQLLSLPGIRYLVALFFKHQISKKVSIKHYPAPYALINTWLNYYGSQQMMEQEALSVAKLIKGETVRNLVRVFFLQSKLKSYGKKGSFNVCHIHIIGAGIMGGSIAAWCALKGFKVTLQDINPTNLSGVMRNAHKLFSSKLNSKQEYSHAVDLLIPDCSGYGIASADVIIEAITENKDAKLAILKDIESKMKPEALLATNTSSISIESLSEALQSPEKLVGIHFFNPVAKMPLVEIVTTPSTPNEVISKATSFTRQIDKFPLPVNNSQGFLVNRVLAPYLVEAFLLFNEGIPIEAIDSAALDFGMPMGPIELADTIGLDICLSIAENLSEICHFEIPTILINKVNDKTLGRKTGSGFYHYKKGVPIKDRDADIGNQEEIQNRLILQILNKSVACLREGVVPNKDMLDAGIIFGTGFAPFKGGPLKYVEDSGLNTLHQTLKEYEVKFGPRFRPDPGWDEI